VFTKLNIKHTLEYNGENDTYLFYGSVINGNKVGYGALNVDSEETKKVIMSIIPVKYQNDFAIDMIEIFGGELPPHSDANIITAINFYLDTADGVTTFYKPKQNVSLRQENIMNETSGYVYNVEDLDIVSSFVAQSGDVYLLDVSSIHSVKTDPNKIRRAYALKSKRYDYYQTLQILKESDVV
jgi:hypothetical protein